MKTKRFISLTLSSCFLAWGFAIFPEKLLAQPPNNLCRDSLIDAANVIENGRNISVVDLHSYQLSNIYRSYPRESPVAVLYVLEGQATEDVLASGQFMTILASRITNACPFIGLVEFGMNQTSWREAFGKVNGQLTNFSCIEPGIPRLPQWGQTVCGI